KLTIAGLSTPPGDDRLKLRGEMTLPFPFSPALDPATSGVRILITDASAATVLDTGARAVQRHGAKRRLCGDAGRGPGARDPGLRFRRGPVRRGPVRRPAAVAELRP